jgi:hypothetical protein
MARCIPGIFVWAPVQNATVNGVVMRAPYDSVWRILISLPTPDADLMASTVRECR